MIVDDPRMEVRNGVRQYPPGYYESNRPPHSEPFFSICIPQYNRTEFLIKACKSFVCQNFTDFEICISDDCSTDQKENELLLYLRNSGVIFYYEKARHNGRYDVNLRQAIAFSRGRFLLLMGNDDGLSDTEVLRTIHELINDSQSIGVAVTNYQELSSGRLYQRVGETKIVGSGPGVAISTFRNYSFVSGIVLKGDLARREAVEAVDGSEMYQMYLATRIVSGGWQLLNINRVCVDKDLMISGQTVDSYRSFPKVYPCPIVERPLPMSQLLQVVAAGLGLAGDTSEGHRNLMPVAKQLYRFTYPFWIIEYRVCQSWRFALGVYLGLRPTRIARGLNLPRQCRVKLWCEYLWHGLVALTVPVRLFDILRPWLYNFAKRARVWL